MDMRKSATVKVREKRTPLSSLRLEDPPIDKATLLLI